MTRFRKIDASAQSKSTYDPMHQFAECGFLRKSKTSDTMEPDTDAMMTHILKCLWALTRHEDAKDSHVNERSKTFNAAVSMISSFSADDLASPIDLERLYPSPNKEECSSWGLNPSEIKSLQRQGETMQSIYADETKVGYFWIPLFASAIIDNTPEDYDCLSINCLRDEYLELVNINGEDSVLLCMETLFGSDRISDANRMHILGVLRAKVPWLFFMRDVNGEYAFHNAARQKCSTSVLRFLLRVNPEAANTVNDEGKTPLYLLLDSDYDESKHFHQFKFLMLVSSKKALRTKSENAYTPLELVCVSDSPCATKTVLALLQACPAAAAIRSDSGDFPIHCFCRYYLLNPEEIIGVAFEALLSAYTKAASETDNSDATYILHKVAKSGTLDMLKLTYEAYPEAVKHCHEVWRTPLVQAVADGKIVEKVEYLYSLYPGAAHLVDGNGTTLLHFAVGSSSALLKTVYSYNPGAIRQAKQDNGHLPLHELVARFGSRLRATLRDNTEKLRFLLAHYSEAARVRDSAGRLPYDILFAITNTEPAQRLLLRAAPEVNPSELHRLNYEARSGALYLLFAAELPESESELDGMGHIGQSPVATTVTTSIGLRRSTRRKATTKADYEEAAAEDDSFIPAQEAVSSSMMIWRLLKARADMTLWKEIVLFL